MGRNMPYAGQSGVAHQDGPGRTDNDQVGAVRQSSDGPLGRTDEAPDGFGVPGNNMLNTQTKVYDNGELWHDLLRPDRGDHAAGFKQRCAGDPDGLQ